jgi:hypothetical protein
MIHEAIFCEIPWRQLQNFGSFLGDPQIGGQMQK